MSFNWTQVALEKVIPSFETMPSHEQDGMIAVATLGIASAVSVGIGLAARAQLGTGDVAIAPAGKLSIRGLIEMCTEFVTNLAERVIGHHGRHYAPFFTAIFFFVLLNNLLGVLPGMTPATQNLNTTVAFGVFMFLTYNFLGVRAVGVGPYLKHFMGPILLLAPLMIPIEIISHLVRPVSLGLRLGNVMTGDHKVLEVFLSHFPLLIPIPFYMMGMFVCFVQAFVFTLLSMVYVSLASAGHDHH